MRIAGEARAPESIREESDARTVGPVFFAREIPAEDGLNAERRQKRSVRLTATQPHGILFGQVTIHAAGLDRGDCFKGSLSRAPIHIVRTQHELLRIEWRHDSKRNQAFILWVGQVAEQDAIHEAENSRGGPDTDGERENCDDGKTWFFYKHPQSESQVLQQGVEKGQAALFAVKFFGLCYAAEFAPRGVASLFRTHAAADVLRGEHF